MLTFNSVTNNIYICKHINLSINFDVCNYLLFFGRSDRIYLRAWKCGETKKNMREKLSHNQENLENGKN